MYNLASPASVFVAWLVCRSACLFYKSLPSLHPASARDYSVVAPSTFLLAKKLIAMAKQSQQLHFLFVPFMAQGHLIPAAEIARLFAQRGVVATIVTTPLNARRIQPVVDDAIDAGFPLRLVQLELPLAEFDLPEGCESMDACPSKDMIKTFLHAVSKLQEPLERLVEEMNPSPSCILADKNLHWMADVGIKFQIPRLSFDGMSCFSLLCSHNIRVFKLHESVSATELFEVPGLPDRVKFTPFQLPGDLHCPPSQLKDFHEKIRDSAETADGYVVNSFEDLEPEYLSSYREVKGDKIWCIGPVSLSNKTAVGLARRGNNKTTVDVDQWLNLQPQRSVIYACLGSLGRLSTSQMAELGLALEKSNHPFIWVIKDDKKGDLNKWIEENGFAQRVKGRGLLIHGWAPQLKVLSHPSTAAFLTHCGWNSVLEGICAAVPLLTWPMFADQFYNETEIVQILKVGASVGSQNCIPIGEEEKFGVLVTRDEIVKAINDVVGEGKEAEVRRERVRRLAEMGKKAVEAGGSSHLNISNLIQHIRNLSDQQIVPVITKPINNNS